MTMWDIYLWTTFIIFGHAALASLILTGCANKKKNEEPKIPKYSMKAVGGGGEKGKNDGGGQSPATTPQSDGKKGASSKEKKGAGAGGGGSAKDAKKNDGKKEPAKGALIAGLNKDHLIPQANEGVVKTERKGDDGGGKEKLVSNPIVSAVTEPNPTVNQPVKENIKTDKTQSEAHTDKTQKEKE